MTTLWHTVRGLSRSPGFAITAVLSLALGIGAGVAAFSVIDAVRFRALPFKDGDRLVLIEETPAEPAAGQGGAPCRGTCDVSYELFANVLKTFPFRKAELVSGFTSGGKALNLGGEPILISAGVASHTLFDLLGVEPMLGRRFTAEDDRLGTTPVTVLSYDLWTNQLGQAKDVVGQTLKLSDTRYTVIGVMPPGFDHEVGSKAWLASVPTLDPSTRPSIKSLTVIARLVRGATMAQLQAELESIDPQVLTKALPGGAAQRSTLTAVPLRDRYVSSTQSHDVIFAAVVGCILLIAVTNMANLTLVRTLHRQRDLAIQSALGAGMGRVVRLLLVEQAVLVGLATMLGLAFAKLLLGILRQVTVLQSLRPAGMEYQLDARAMAFALGLAALIAVVLSVVPTRLLRRTDVQTVLRQSSQGLSGAWGRGAQQGFVVAQLAATVVLLTGAGLMTKTVLRLAEVDLGFDSRKVIQGTPSFPHPWRVKEKYIPVTQQIVTELDLLPNTERVSIRALEPIGSGPASIVLAGQSAPLPAGLTPRLQSAIDTGYFAALGIAMARGRSFGPTDVAGSPPVAIVNQWAADRWWPGQDPIGKVIVVDTAPGAALSMEVVGVVANNRAASPALLLADLGAELYRPLTQAPSAFPTFLIRAQGGAAPLLKPIKETLARLVPDRPLFAGPVQEQADQQLSGVRVNAYQILGFALIGLALAIVGVYGVLSYAVSRRTQEIGIRGALGAGQAALGGMVILDSLRLAGIAVAVGVPLALLATRSLTSILYGTNPKDPVVLGLVALGLLVVVIAASWWPARRAARVDPLQALRST